MIDEKEREGYLKTISETVNPKERRAAHQALRNRLDVERLDEYASTERKSKLEAN